MNADDFVKEIEKYYGAYENEDQREIIRVWLEDNLSLRDLDKLYKVTVEEFSSRWGKVPDIAIFKEVIKKYNHEHGEWYKYAGGKIEFLGKGIGVGSEEQILLPHVKKQIEDKTGHD